MYDKICKLIAERLDIDVSTITPQSEVIKDLGADSLDIFDLMNTLEDEYNITLPEEGVENVKTVQDIVDMMEQLQKKN